MNTASAANLQLHLTLAHSSLLLEALMEQPFKNVFEIIGSLNAQAQQFYQAPAEKNRAQLFVISKSDCAICIKALGELPYNRVSNLIANLHQQLHGQLLSTTQIQEPIQAQEHDVVPEQESVA